MARANLAPCSARADVLAGSRYPPRTQTAGDRSWGQIAARRSAFRSTRGALSRGCRIRQEQGKRDVERDRCAAASRREGLHGKEGSTRVSQRCWHDRVSAVPPSGCGYGRVYGCAYRSVSNRCLSPQLASVTTCSICSGFHCVAVGCGSFARTFNPKVAGSIPARPIKPEKTREAEPVESHQAGFRILPRLPWVAWLGRLPR